MQSAQLSAEKYGHDRPQLLTCFTCVIITIAEGNVARIKIFFERKKRPTVNLDLFHNTYYYTFLSELR